MLSQTNFVPTSLGLRNSFVKPCMIGQIDLFVYHHSIMSFSPDSVTKPDVEGKGRDYSSHWHVCVLLLCCLNLITSMPRYKAFHCGKSFFPPAKVIMPINTFQTNSRLRQYIDREECLKICKNPSLIVMFKQTCVHTTHLQLFGCLYSQLIHLSDVAEKWWEMGWEGFTNLLEVVLRHWVIKLKKTFTDML